MFSLILGAITGLAGPISSVINRIQDVKIELAKVQSDTERNKLLAEKEELEARKSVLIAEAGHRLNAIVRTCLAAGPCVFLFKVFVFDKVVGSLVRGITGKNYLIFRTDPLDDNLWGIVVAVVAFYFLYDMTARFRSGK